MALRNEEIVRAKFELGYNVTGVGAEPYITYVALFDRAVQPYLIDLGSTSTTTVAASTAGKVVTVTVAVNPPGPSTSVSVQPLSFITGSNVVVDVGPNQEVSVIQNVSSLVLTLLLFKAHSGTYPVLLQGAESIVRDCFARLDQIKAEMLNVAPKTAGLAALTGEIEFFSSGHQNRKGGRSKFEELVFQRTVARRDLAGALGVPYLGDIRNRGGSTFECY